MIRQRSSPLVRKIAKEHNVDIGQIRGCTGLPDASRRDDILRVHLDRRASQTPAAPRQRTRLRAIKTVVDRKAWLPGIGQAGKTVPMSIVRKKIAERTW